MAQARVSKRAVSRLRKVSKVSPSNTLQNVDQYVHDYEKRRNNPPVGLVTPETDKELPRKRYEYDPHLEPQLQWASKKENTSFEVDTVSLHVHERIDPLTIIEKVRKKPKVVPHTLFHYFEQPENNPPLREAIDFYKHSQNWSNRLIAGDSLLVMNSLLQKEGMAGKVQMIYIDPPYGIRYGSNFQPFVNRRQVSDGKDEDLTQEPEMVKAFRDTWELGIHSYLTYMRDRLLLARELLQESGSVFVQISDENVHHVRELLDEIFGVNNFVSMINYKTKKMTMGNTRLLETIGDRIIWYAKSKEACKFHPLFIEKDWKGDLHWSYLELADGTRRTMTATEKKNPESIPAGSRVFIPLDMRPSGYFATGDFDYEFGGRIYKPGVGKSWRTNKVGMDNLKNANRLYATATALTYVLYFDDYPVSRLTNFWSDTEGAYNASYVVQTATKVIQRCLLMTTDPGDLVLDPTCGSGTTAFVAEQWGRRWITCDTSRVAVTLAKQRLVTALYDYYELQHPYEGISSGFKYQTIPHVTLGSIANNESPAVEILYDRPHVDRSKLRVCGPFTLEAVPAPTVKPLDETTDDSVDNSLARSGETPRQDQWRNELLATGVLTRGAEKIIFSRMEPLQGADWLHADAETKERQPRRVVVSFGPEYAPLEQRQVARAIEEAQNLVPRPKIVLFAAFQFDPEAAKDIDEMKWEGVTVLRVQMNTDLFTEDLKKKVSRSQSFWLMGQPDVELKKQKDGKYVVEVHGFDYYNPKTHEIESGDKSRIAMWMLDTDYDGRSLYLQQIFFPMAGADAGGWARIGKSVKAEIDEGFLEKYRGTTSLPFEKGPNKRVAVKIIDDRGIESLRILKVK